MNYFRYKSCKEIIQNTLINNEGILGKVSTGDGSLVSAEKEENFRRVGANGIDARLIAQVESGHLRGYAVEDVEHTPAVASFGCDAGAVCYLLGKLIQSSTVSALERSRSDDDRRASGTVQHLGEWVASGSDFLQYFR